MRHHVTCSQSRIDGRQRGRAAIVVHQNSASWEALFTVHSVKVRVTSRFISFLNEVICILSLHRDPTANTEKDAELLGVMQPGLSQTKVVMALGDFTVTLPDINWENANASRGIP